MGTPISPTICIESIPLNAALPPMERNRGSGLRFPMKHQAASVWPRLLPVSTWFCNVSEKMKTFTLMAAEQPRVTLIYFKRCNCAPAWGIISLLCWLAFILLWWEILWSLVYWRPLVWLAHTHTHTVTHATDYTTERYQEHLSLYSPSSIPPHDATFEALLQTWPQEFALSGVGRAQQQVQPNAREQCISNRSNKAIGSNGKIRFFF